MYLIFATVAFYINTKNRSVTLPRYFWVSNNFFLRVLFFFIFVIVAFIFIAHPWFIFFILCSPFLFFFVPEKDIPGCLSVCCRSDYRYRDSRPGHQANRISQLRNEHDCSPVGDSHHVTDSRYKPLVKKCSSTQKTFFVSFFRHICTLVTNKLKTFLVKWDT